MTLSTRDIIQRDDHGDIIWDELTPEERDAAMERMAEVAKEVANERRKVRITLYVFLAVFLAVLILLSWMSSGRAHDFWINHSGYKSLTDGTHCCGNNDCFEYPAEEVRAERGGWLIKPLGELVPYNDTQASEDGKFWRCKKWDGSRRCFFAPQPSS